jgi:D-amino-acid dehydrogenase
LQQWREDDRLDGFDWRRNGKLVTFRNAASFEHARSGWPISSSNRCCRRWIARLEPALAEAGFVGGIYTPDEEVADCHAFCQRLAARLEASGRCELRWAQSHRHSPRRRRGQAIDLGEQVMPVDQLVLAAGHRSAAVGLPGCRCRCTRSRATA